MSNIIKSFRVIESNVVSQDADIEIEKKNAIYEDLLIEAKQRYKDIISQANEEAERIVDKAYSEYDERLNDAYEKAKEIFEEHKLEGHDEGYKLGKEQGYTEGYKEGKEEAEELVDEALDIKKFYIEKRNNMLKEAENDLIELVISIYEKVIYKKIEEDGELIVSLVMNGIDNLEIKDKLTIIVSQDDYEIANKSKNIILAKASLIDEVDIRVNSDMVKGDCILETSKGNVDVSIKNQLDEVRDLIISILNNE